MGPYPYERWPRVTRDEAVETRAHARAEPLASMVRAAPAARAWLGVTPILIDVGPAERATIDDGADPIVAVLMEDARGERAALTLDAFIATVMIDRTLGGEGTGLDGASGPLRDLERGVLAHAFARWLGDARSGFGVAAVLSSSAALRRALGGERMRRALSVHLGSARGRAALYLPERAAAAPRHLPRWAGGVPIEMVVRGGSALLAVHEIATLSRGDVLIPDACELRVGGGALAGAARLETRGTACAWRVAIERTQMTIVEPELDTTPGRRGAREVKDVKDGDRLLDKVGDTPVTLTLELARFVLPLEEIAALAPGEIIRTGARIGERVSLRAGDRVVAIGELVDVEGEVGLRILELPE